MDPNVRITHLPLTLTLHADYLALVAYKLTLERIIGLAADEPFNGPVQEAAEMATRALERFPTDT